MTAQASGVYEGIFLVPSLFANARDKSSFKKNLKWVILTIFIYVFFFTPLAIFRFGHRVQEVIIMNLQPSTIQMDLITVFAISMAFSAGMNYVPLNDIAHHSLPNLAKYFTGRVFIRLIFLIPIMFLVAIMKNITIFLALNSSIGANYV